MNLSEHFTLEEMTFSEAASRRNLDNTPDEEALDNLKHTAECMEKVRDLLGSAIAVNSAYRSPEVNKAVGSTSKKSQHLSGQAVDFTCRGFGTPRDVVEAVIASDIEFDQIILEFDRWVHISFTKGRNRQQALIIDSNGTREFS